jgi:hypothetical protein
MGFTLVPKHLSEEARKLGYTIAPQRSHHIKGQVPLIPTKPLDHFVKKLESSSNKVLFRNDTMINPVQSIFSQASPSSIHNGDTVNSKEKVFTPSERRESKVFSAESSLKDGKVRNGQHGSVAPDESGPIDDTKAENAFDSKDDVRLKLEAHIEAAMHDRLEGEARHIRKKLRAEALSKSTEVGYVCFKL